MNIDFPPPSKGTYNNAGSSRKLCNYLEHEDMERMEKGIYTEGFFNLIDESLYKSQVIKDIDNNKAQLLKTDAKFYAIHVSPSEKELKAIGNTEQEQAEAMRRYIREVFIPEYAKNFNKGLSAEEIKFYGKIHFDRDRSENTKDNMHCHLIVSRKDQSNKIKISPLTNHRNTKKGAIKGGFDRTNLFKSVEVGFDKLFDYDRPLVETFEYCNMMKNGSIVEQLKMQELEIKVAGEKKKEQVGICADKQDSITIEQHEYTNSLDHSSTNESINQSTSSNDSGLSSALGIFAPEVHGEHGDYYIKKLEKRTKRQRGLGR